MMRANVFESIIGYAIHERADVIILALPFSLFDFCQVLPEERAAAESFAALATRRPS